jgi:hypothetical protein
MSSHEILAVFSWSNFEALAMCVVLAQSRVMFHPCKCGLCGGDVTVAAVLIGYDDMKVAIRTITTRRWLWMITSSTLSVTTFVAALTLLSLLSASVTIHDLLLTSILGWHGRSSASVIYLFPYSSIRAVLRSSWSGSCAMVICDGY